METLLSQESVKQAWSARDRPLFHATEHVMLTVCVRKKQYNTDGQQSETATEKTVLAILAANGIADAAVDRDALATGVEAGRLEEVDGRYRVAED